MYLYRLQIKWDYKHYYYHYYYYYYYYYYWIYSPFLVHWPLFSVFNPIYSRPMLDGSPCHYSMVRPRATDGG
jgi:hypothetical protein